jgi:hypothetical protein
MYGKSYILYHYINQVRGWCPLADLAKTPFEGGVTCYFEEAGDMTLPNMKVIDALGTRRQNWFTKPKVVRESQ